MCASEAPEGPGESRWGLGEWTPRVVWGRSPWWITWLSRGARVRPEWLGKPKFGRGSKLLSLGRLKESMGGMQGVRCLADECFAHLTLST